VINLFGENPWFFRLRMNLAMCAASLDETKAQATGLSATGSLASKTTR
jgi:hypothetical protein